MRRWRVLVGLLFFSVLEVAAQVPANLTVNMTGGTLDASGATFTAPFQSGTLAMRPATCQANTEYYNATDATPAGHRLYACNSSGTGWVLVGGSGLTVAQLSAATGTVAAPTCTGGGEYLYYRYDVSGTLTIPAVSGACRDGQEITFVLKSVMPQDVTFTMGAGGFAADANIPLPSTTTAGTTYDYYRYRYNAAAARWLLVGTPQSTAPLAVSAGGTGQALLAAHGVVIGQGTDPVHTAVPTAAYQCLMSSATNPTTTTPTFQACLEVGPVLKILTDNSAIPILTLAVASNTGSSVRLEYHIEVLTAANAVQAESGSVVCKILNQNGVLSANGCTETSSQALGSGTLTTTWVLSAATPAHLTLNANTSLTPKAGYPRLRYSAKSLGGQALVLQ